MKIFESSIERLLKSDTDIFVEEKPAQSLDYDSTSVTNITLQNEFSLDDISDGFESESRRYTRSLELI